MLGSAHKTPRIPQRCRRHRHASHRRERRIFTFIVRDLDLRCGKGSFVTSSRHRCRTVAIFARRSSSMLSGATASERMDWSGECSKVRPWEAYAMQTQTHSKLARDPLPGSVCLSYVMPLLEVFAETARSYPNQSASGDFTSRSYSTS